MSVFDTLNRINVNDHTEKKGNLTYLSWAWAWAEVKKAFPEAYYTIYENEHGWNYFTDGRTCWVKTGVTIEGLEHIEYLPVMDFKNKSILLESITSFEVNKTIQRSLTKACARHGLGLYIYAGEDIPDGEERQAREARTEKVKATEIGEVRARALEQHLSENGIMVKTIYDLYKVKGLKDLTEAQHKNIVDNIVKIKEMQDGDKGKTA